MKIKKITEALRITNQQINDVFLMLETRMKASYFTRGIGKMDFKNLILFALNFVKKSIQIELDSFIKNIMKSEITMTKQAYSQARQKISPRAFILLAEGIIKWYYADDFKTYRGYKLSAIDGSILEVKYLMRVSSQFLKVVNEAKQED